MITFTFDITTDPSIILHTEPFFNANFEIEWFQDHHVQNACLDIDKVRYIDGDYFKHPTLGGFPARSLSTGLKSVILLIKYDTHRMLKSSFLGDNCWKHLKFIPKDKDVTIMINSYLPRYAFDNELEVYLKEFDVYVNNYKEYLRYKTEWSIQKGWL